MTTLHDRLHGLAEDAPDGRAPTPSDDLWSRGRRLQRTRRAVSVSLAAVLVLTVGSLATLVIGAADRPDLAPADAEATLQLPDRIYDPGPWAAEVEDTGPIGPLVALLNAERRTFWGESATGVAGVSVTGEYAFLPLTGTAQLASDEVEDPKLSPDGRFVAYAVAGPTRAEPNDLEGDPLAGVAVYDTVTGETSRQLVPTDHGLDVLSLGWIDDTLFMKYRQFDTFVRTENGFGTTTVDPGVLTWDPGSGVVDTTLAPRAVPDLYDATAVTGGRVVPRGQRRFVIIDDSGVVRVRGEVDARIEGPFLVSPDGSRVAGRLDPDGVGTSSNTPSAIVVADVSGPRAGVTVEVTTSAAGPVAWRGDDQLVVASQRPEPDGAGLDSVDVGTGEREPLLSIEQGVYGFPLVAHDAWSAPLLDAPEPDAPGDPRRIFWVGGGIAVLLAGLAFWRRRVRL